MTDRAGEDQGEGGDGRAGRDGFVLLASIFFIAISGLVYELIAGTLSSYLLGDSVTQFSLVIGLFLTAMGFGSFLSRYCVRHLLSWFCFLEITVGLVGGFAALVGFATFSFTELYEPVFFAICAVIGTLVGLEIPIMIRILREMESLRITVSNVLSADYLGALFGSILFPFALVPHLGLVRAGLIMGLSNVAVGGIVCWWFRDRLGAHFRRLTGLAGIAFSLLFAGFILAGTLTTWLEDQIYQDEIILAENSAYQRIVVTRWRDDVRLYLNGHLQFSTVDEYRYHEALVHPVMGLAEQRESVLILGGGDGLAVQRVLAYPDVGEVTVVDLDNRVTDLFRNHPFLSSLNGGALSDERVRIVNQDAMAFLEERTRRWDVIIMDLPDPSDPALGKLYSRSFFRLAGKHLARGGLLVTQATSPFRSREAFWCIVHTIRAARVGPGRDRTFRTLPYHVLVPTFGTWGFVLAGEWRPDPGSARIEVPTRYLSESMLPTLFAFPPDMAEVETPVSSLDDPVVSRLYVKGYNRYLE